MKQEPNDEIIKSGVNPDNIRKWKVFVFKFFNIIISRSLDPFSLSPTIWC